VGEIVLRSLLFSLLIPGSVMAAASSIGAAQATVHVETAKLDTPRTLQDLTRTAAVRDYLEAWRTVGMALNQNNAGVLDRDFVGSARDRLNDTIQQQAAAGIHTRYQDKSHDIRIVFYSPEGLSLQMTDNVEYDVQVFDHDKALTTQHVHARYIVVMTPAEVKWRVRVFQAQPE
jgi:hypothetical protein